MFFAKMGVRVICSPPRKRDPQEQSTEMRMSKTKEEILAQVKAGTLDVNEAGRLLSEARDAATGHAVLQS